MQTDQNLYCLPIESVGTVEHNEVKQSSWSDYISVGRSGSLQFLFTSKTPFLMLRILCKNIINNKNNDIHVAFGNVLFRSILGELEEK